RDSAPAVASRLRRSHGDRCRGHLRNPGREDRRPHVRWEDRTEVARATSDVERSLRSRIGVRVVRSGIAPGCASYSARQIETEWIVTNVTTLFFIDTMSDTAG